MKYLKLWFIILFLMSSSASLSGQATLGTDCTEGAKLFFIDPTWAGEAYRDTGEKAEKLDYINLLLVDGGLVYNTSKLADYTSLPVVFVDPKNSASDNMVLIGVEDNAPMKALYELLCVLDDMTGLDKSQYGIYFFRK